MLCQLARTPVRNANEWNNFVLLALFECPLPQCDTGRALPVRYGNISEQAKVGVLCARLISRRRGTVPPEYLLLQPHRDTQQRRGYIYTQQRRGGGLGLDTPMRPRIHRPCRCVPFLNISNGCFYRTVRNGCKDPPACAKGDVQHHFWPSIFLVENRVSNENGNVFGCVFSLTVKHYNLKGKYGTR